MVETIKNNIRYLARTNGIKLGDLERDSGVQAGYLSRKNHMTVEVLLNFCKNLSVTPNDLIYHNYKNDELDAEISELKEKIRELELKKEAQDE